MRIRQRVPDDRADETANSERTVRDAAGDGSLPGDQHGARGGVGRVGVADFSGPLHEDTLDVGLPPLRMKVVGCDAKFAIDERRIRNVRYLVEQSRGYDESGDLYSPGAFRAEL